MSNYASRVTQGKIVLTISELIDLLESELQCLEKAYEEDSSWNYGIEELKEEIKLLKKL